MHSKIDPEFDKFDEAAFNLVFQNRNSLCGPIFKKRSWMKVTFAVSWGGLFIFKRVKCQFFKEEIKWFHFSL